MKIMATHMLLTFLFLTHGPVTRDAFNFGAVTTYSIVREKTGRYYNGNRTTVFQGSDGLSMVTCAYRCGSVKTCGGFNYCNISGNRSCDAVLANVEPIDHEKFSSIPGCEYYHKITGQCLNGGVRTLYNTCWCMSRYSGEICENFVKDCTEAYQRGLSKTCSITIQPDLNITEFRAKCILDEGPVTRILMRDQSVTDSFHDKNMPHYKNGIWYPAVANSWIGLEKLHRILTNSVFNYTAKVTVVFLDDSTLYTGNYSNFHVQGEEQGYTVSYSSYTSGEFPLADGFSAPDGSGSINGQRFCAPNEDDCECAINSQSGWWFVTGCGNVSPTVPLSELVWPKSSSMVPVEKLFIDIIANIP